MRLKCHYWRSIHYGRGNTLSQRAKHRTAQDSTVVDGIEEGRSPVPERKYIRFWAEHSDCLIAHPE